MKKILKISKIISILTMSLLFVSCSKNIEGVKCSTATEAIELFNKYNRENNIEEIVKLYSDVYVDYIGFKRSKIIQVLQSNRKNANITKSEVKSIEDINENLKKAVITISSTNQNGESVEDFEYAVVKEDDGWAVSPEGVVGNINFDVPMDKKGELNLNLVKEAIVFDGGIIKVNLYNDYSSDITFGTENSKTEIVVETTKGTYKSMLENTVNVKKKTRSYFLIKIDGIQGEIEEVTFTSIYDIDKSGNIIDDSKRDVIAFKR